MPLKVALMEKDDLDDFVEVDDAATKEWSYAKAMASGLPSHLSRKDLIKGEMSKHFKQDEIDTWLKVVDTETGVLVAGALWRFHSEPDVTLEQDVADVTAEQIAVGAPDKERSFMDGQQQRTKAFLRKHVRGQPYAYLAVLMTDPKHQRRGAGGLLVKWGCDKADERGILSVLNSSPAGLSIYQAHGFEIVEQYDLDLRPWGVDETTIRRGLIRPARTNASGHA